MKRVHSSYVHRKSLRKEGFRILVTSKLAPHMSLTQFPCWRDMCGEHDLKGAPIDLMRFFTFCREFFLPAFTTVRVTNQGSEKPEKKNTRVLSSNYKKIRMKKKKGKEYTLILGGNCRIAGEAQSHGRDDGKDKKEQPFNG